MTADLAVAHAYPDAWRSVPGLPLLAAEPWNRATSGRFDGEAVWLWFPAAGGRVAAGLAGFVVSRPDAYLYGNAAALLTDPASPFAGPGVAARLAARPVDAAALLPHLLLTHPGYSTFPVGGSSGDPEILRELLAAVLRWAAGRGLAAVALPYVASGSPLARAARTLGLDGWRIGEDSTLTVPGGGFDAYLDGMRSHRRQRVRAERHRLHERGLRGRNAGVPDPGLLERMAELRVQQRRKYGLAGDRAAERRRLAEVVAALGARVDTFVVEQHGPGEARSEAVSFALLARDGDTWHGLAGGSDYADPRSRDAYFEAAYYAPIDEAPRCGVRRISYGLTAGHAKALRGCTAEPVDCLVVGVSPAGRRAVAGLRDAWAPAPADATAG